MITNRHSLNFLLRITLFALRRYVFFLFRLQLQGFEAIKTLRQPPIIVGNHVSNWDPIWTIGACNERIRFLASDLVFRRPILGRLLRWAGMISKRKFYSDPKAVRAMKQSLSQGDWIGFYPEGQANWDGNLASFIEGTGKLLKFLGAPVVCIKTSGAYFTQGRWAWPKQTPRITLTVTRILSQEEVKALSANEIEQIIRENSLEDPWNTDPNLSVSGIEGALVYCPYCGSSHSLFSQRRTISCTSCGIGARVSFPGGKIHWNLPGGFNNSNEPEPSADTDLPSSVPQWFIAQDKWFSKTGAGVWKGLTIPYLYEEHSRFLGKKFRIPVTQVWQDDGLTFQLINEQNEILRTFHVNSLEWLNIQMGERIEFRMKKELFVLQPIRPRGGYPLYRWKQLQEQGD